MSNDDILPDEWSPEPQNLPVQTERWCVSYIDGDGSDEWQLLRNSVTVYFETEREARVFAADKAIPKKLFYWQPRVWKEVSYQITTTHWKPS